MMTISSELKSFIEQYVHLIDENNFEDLYDLTAVECLTNQDIGTLTSILYESLQVNILDHLSYRVPLKFLFGQHVPASFTIPSHITHIAYQAFAKSDISQLVLPSSFVKIGEQAFSNCSYLSKVDFGQVELIDTRAFEACNSLTEVILPNSCEKVGERAFGSCKGLQKVVLPNCNCVVGPMAFAGCKELQTVEIPKDVVLNGTHIFRWCNDTLQIYCYKDSQADIYLQHNYPLTYKDTIVYM